MSGRPEFARRPIALVGFMASGKTTVGRALASRLGRTFVDSDQEIEREFGLPIPAIFTRHGEAKFREAERQLISQLLRGRDEVLSLGGGAFLDSETRAAVNAQAISVWLDPPFDLLLERIALSGMRPLASGKPPGELRQLWEERCEIYAEAHVRMTTSAERPEELVERIIERIGGLETG